MAYVAPARVAKENEKSVWEGGSCGVVQINSRRTEEQPCVICGPLRRCPGCSILVEVILSDHSVTLNVRLTRNGCEPGVILYLYRQQVARSLGPPWYSV